MKSAVAASVALLFSCFLFTACSEYQEILKSEDMVLKLQKAREYYNEESYYKALPLFEELLTFYKGTQSAEEIYYFFSYSNFYLGDYLIAAYHFKNFASTYPDSKYAEECMFMNAKCYYLIAPHYELEQANSIKAIEELQLFANAFPESNRIADANSMIDDMRNTLMQKAFYGAELYFKLGKYKAASIALKNVLEEYPDSPDSEEISFLIIKSNYLYAVNSIQEKQEERYRAVIESYQMFSKKFSGSSYSREAENLYEASIKSISKIEQQ